MWWLLLAATAWTLIAVLAAPVVGRILALDGRPPRRRRGEARRRPASVSMRQMAHPLG